MSETVPLPDANSEDPEQLPDNTEGYREIYEAISYTEDTATDPEDEQA